MINKANNILITGAAGYIGSHVVEKLVKTKSKIIAIEPRTNPSVWAPEFRKSNLAGEALKK